MKPIDAAGFERRFQADLDPWNYAGSHFERVKRAALIHACGERSRARVLELACANGETTLALAARSLRILAVDASPTVAAEAARRTAALPRIEIGVAVLPDAMPRGRFELIVVSELLYYLPPDRLRRLLAKLSVAVAPGGRIVLLHHLRRFADASRPPPLVHRDAAIAFSSALRLIRRDRCGAYEILVFDRPQP